MSGLLRGKLPFVCKFVPGQPGKFFSIHTILSVLSASALENSHDVMLSRFNFQSVLTNLWRAF